MQLCIQSIFPYSSKDTLLILSVPKMKPLFWISFVLILFCHGSPSLATIPTSYSSYRPNAFCNASYYMEYPTNISQVVTIVKNAINLKTTVKAIGARHSETDIICTEGIPVDMHGINYTILNPDKTATFGAGIILRDLTTFLRNNNLAIRTMPANGNITLGGAIGTGAHGSTVKYNASISSQVVGMTIVDGSGVIQTITAEKDLMAFRIHLGLLGIIVDVTLATVPLYKVRGNNYLTSDDILTNGTAVELVENTDQISIYWFPAFKEVIVATWTIVDVNTTGEAFTYDHMQPTYDNFAAAGASAVELIMSLTTSTCAIASSMGYSMLHIFELYTQAALITQTPDWVPIYTEDGTTLKMPAVGYFDLMFAPVCSPGPADSSNELGLACWWDHGSVNGNITILDNELCIPLTNLSSFVSDVKDILTKTPTAFPAQGILFRFSNPSTTFMSTSYGVVTVHIEFYYWHRKDTYNNPTASLAGYQTILQTLANKYNGRSHWGKSGLVYHNSASIALKFQNNPTALTSFVRVMDKYDPNGVFLNSFGRRLKRNGTKVDIDPNVTHCALLDNCFCSRNSDCGVTQQCVQIQGYGYNVCNTINQVPSYTPLILNVTLPSPLGFVNWLLTVVPTLVASVKVPCLLPVVG